MWLERRDGYVRNFLQSFSFVPGDCIIVFSHGGLNAAPLEAALYARDKGVQVISVSSLSNAAATRATHSSGKKLSDVADGPQIKSTSKLPIDCISLHTSRVIRKISPDKSLYSELPEVIADSPSEKGPHDFGRRAGRRDDLLERISEELKCVAS